MKRQSLFTTVLIPLAFTILASWKRVDIYFRNFTHIDGSDGRVDSCFLERKRPNNVPGLDYNKN